MSRCLTPSGWVIRDNKEESDEQKASHQQAWIWDFDHWFPNTPGAEFISPTVQLIGQYLLSSHFLSIGFLKQIHKQMAFAKNYSLLETLTETGNWIWIDLLPVASCSLLALHRSRILAFWSVGVGPPASESPPPFIRCLPMYTQVSPTHTHTQVTHLFGWSDLLLWLR